MVLSELHLELSELYEQLETLENCYDDRVSDKEIEEQDEAIVRIVKQINDIKKLIA